MGSEVSTAAKVVPAASVALTRASKISLECSACLENLDAPARINDCVPVVPAENGSNVVVRQQVDGTVGTPRGNTRKRGRGAASSRGRRKGSASSRGRERRSGDQQNVTPMDVVATHCGHLFHQICVESWFERQGKRSCPRCRKSVSKSKLIRLDSSISVDNGTRRSIQFSLDISGPGPCASAPPPEVDFQNQDAGDSNGTECPCLDLKVMHNTLINDYNDLEEQFKNLRPDSEPKEAQIRRLMEDNERQSDEIQRLEVVRNGLYD